MKVGIATLWSPFIVPNKESIYRLDTPAISFVDLLTTHTGRADSLTGLMKQAREI